jgi:hypothetical protein
MAKKILQGGGSSFYTTSEVNALLAIKEADGVMDTTYHPYVAGIFKFKRQLNSVDMYLENFNFELSWSEAASHPLFTVPLGYRPVNGATCLVFCKDQIQLSSIALYINSSGLAVWSWSKTPSTSYSVPFQNLSCKSGWFTTDPIPT